MFLHILKSKIHRVKVTEANLEYIGSITIDEDLMDAANIYAGEKVQVVDNTNGARLELSLVNVGVVAFALMGQQHILLT